MMFGEAVKSFNVGIRRVGSDPAPAADVPAMAAQASPDSARALAESLPYLRQASKVGILVIEGESKTEADPLKGNDAVLHLRHHGINAVKYRAIAERRDCRRADCGVPQAQR